MNKLQEDVDSRLFKSLTVISHFPQLKASKIKKLHTLANGLDQRCSSSSDVAATLSMLYQIKAEGFQEYGIVSVNISAKHFFPD